MLGSTKPEGRQSPLATKKILASLERYDQDLAAIITKDSNGSSTGRIASVDRQDLQRIRLLGTGRFSNVYLVIGSLSSFPEDPKTINNKQMYAYKAIDPTRACNTEALVSAANDLATEALFLSQLEHDNIIQLRGLCSKPFSNAFIDDAVFFNTVTDLNGSFLQHQQHTDRNNELEGYFLVMDVLAETLSQRLNRWREHKRNYENMTEVSLSGAGADDGRRRSWFRCFSTATTDNPIIDLREVERMYERVQCVGLGIAKGMEYLASKGIILRDLKPSNVGFAGGRFDEDYCDDSASKVKLFDFGMARHVGECDPGEICGSPRYMAPECMSGDGYTLKVDVYSFGILLFELCSLIVPFSNLFCNTNNNNNRKTNKRKNLSVGSRHLRPLSKASSPLWKKIVNGINNRRHHRDDKSYGPDCNNSTTNEISSKFNTGHTSTSRTRMTKEFYRQVVEQEIRPTDNIDFLSAVPCPRLRSLIVECWQPDPTKRPAFQEIVPRLQDILFYSKGIVTVNEFNIPRDRRTTLPYSPMGWPSKPRTRNKIQLQQQYDSFASAIILHPTQSARSGSLQHDERTEQLETSHSH